MNLIALPSNGRWNFNSGNSSYFINANYESINSISRIRPFACSNELLRVGDIGGSYYYGVGKFRAERNAVIVDPFVEFIDKTIDEFIEDFPKQRILCKVKDASEQSTHIRNRYDETLRFYNLQRRSINIYIGDCTPIIADYFSPYLENSNHVMIFKGDSIQISLYDTSYDYRNYKILRVAIPKDMMVMDVEEYSMCPYCKFLMEHYNNTEISVESDKFELIL